jgi:hypothetical protein
MPIPVFTQVVYLSPWFPVPQGWANVGVDAVVAAPGTPGQVLAGRLRQGDTTLLVGIGLDATEVILIPTSPLSATLAYFLDVQWVAPTTPPASIVWTPGTFATSPIVTSVVTLTGASISGSVVSLGWDFGATAITPAGANITAYNTAGGSAGFSRVQGLTGTMNLNSTQATAGTKLYLQGVMPIYGGPGTGFTLPFTMGPIVAGAPLPLSTSAPTITSIQYDGGTVQVAWTAPPPPTTGGSVGYELVVSAGGASPASTVFEASAGGGMAVLGPSPPPGGWSVAVRVRIGPVIGASGSAIAVLTQTPMIDQIAVKPGGAGVTARVAFASGTSALVELLKSGVVVGSGSVSSSGGTVDITAAGVSGEGWQLRGRIQTTTSGASVTGPVSAPVAVLADPPAIADIAISSNPAASSGWIVTVTAAEPPPAGASLVVALSQGSTAIASQIITDGTSATFALTQGAAGPNRIDGTNVGVASLTTTTPAGASPAGQAKFIGAAPTTTAVQNIGPDDPSGLPQGLQVDVASGGQAGQVLAIRLIAAGRVMMTSLGANSTHANLALTQPLDPSLDWRIQGRWTGGDVTDTTFGGWSTPVTVMTSTTTVLEADYDNNQLTLAIQTPQGVAPAQGAYLFACKTGGGSITGTPVIGTRGSFPLTPGSDTWQAAAKPFQPLPPGSNSRTLAPSSAPAPLLITAPTPASISYDGTMLSASWNVVTDANGNPATGAIIEISDGSGEVVTAPAASASGQMAVQLAASTQSQAKLRVRATRVAASGEFRGAYCAPVAPLVAAPMPGTVALGLDGQQKPLVKAVLTIPAGVLGGTTYRAWLLAGDQVVSGPVAAVTDQGITMVSFPFAAIGLTGLSIVAQAEVTGSAPTLEGPRSAPVPVLTVAPSFVAALISPASSTEWKLDASWLPPADRAAIVSYTLSVIKNADSSVVAKTIFGAVGEGSLTFAMSAVDATLPYTLTLVATSANGSMTPLASTAVWFTAPAFTAVTSGPGQVNAQWTAPVGPTGVAYQLSLLDTVANTVLATTVTAATNGGLDVSALGLLPSGSYALALGIQFGPLLFQAGSDGTYKTRPVLLLNQPAGLAVTTDAASGKATLNWSAIPGASGYTVAFANGSPPVQVSTASYLFPSTLSAGEDLRVSVTANIASNGVVSTGPSSASLAVPTLAPVLTSADYDGINVSGAWAPLAGAAGYVATILNAAGAAVGSSQTSDITVAFPLPLTAADGPFTIVVQALTDAGSGLPSAPLPLFQPALFVSTALPGTEPPNIYPAATLGLEATQISIYLPPLADAAITVSPVGAFKLQANTDAATRTALPYVLTFASDSEVWKFSANGNPLPAIRPQLRLDYISFLQAVETAGASAWGVSVLQQAISRWMPQTFAESHYYAYGLSLTGGPGTGSIDLRQGLVLRVGFANYTNVWSGESNSWLNGFGGGSPADFDVADSMSGAGGWQLSMDSFVAMLTASGAITVSPPGTITAAGASAGVADPADLFFPSFPNPFYRLFFPRQLEDPTGTGSVLTNANFALASAASFTALSSSTPLPGTTTPLAFFRGRAVLRMMIRIRVNGAELVVPLGTTVGNVLDRYGVRPPATAIQLTGVTLERASGPGLAVLGPSPQPPPLTYDSATRRRVRLDWSTMANYVGPVDATNLPLLHGDRIEF